VLKANRATPELSDEGYENLQRMFKVPLGEKQATRLFMSRFCSKDAEWSLHREIPISTADNMLWTRAVSVAVLKL